jgi:hypothetical protein
VKAREAIFLGIGFKPGFPAHVKLPSNGADSLVGPIKKEKLFSFLDTKGMRLVIGQNSFVTIRALKDFGRFLQEDVQSLHRRIWSTRSYPWWLR